MYELPARADLIVAIDYTKTPAWFGLTACSRKRAIASVRARLAAQGASAAYAELAEAQRMADRSGEWFFEVARRFGNMRFHRLAMAVDLPPRLDARDAAGLELIVDGRFDTGRFAARFAAEKLEAERGEAGLKLVLPARELTLQVSDSRLRVVQGERPAGGGREELPVRLKQAGFPGPALFCHLRRGAKLPPETGMVPGLAGLATATLTASFGEDVRVEFSGEYADEAAAARTAGLLDGFVEGWKPSKEIAALMESIRIAREGRRVHVLLDLRGTTADEVARLLAAAGD